MSARGFALLEWLIASAFVLVIAGALFAAVAPVRDIVERSQQGADLASSARTALDLVVASVREAGSDAAIGPADVSLADTIAPITLLQDLDAGLPGVPSTAVVINRVLHGAAQARLRLPAQIGDNVLSLETAARCSHGVPACGFVSGDTAVVFSNAVSLRVVIDSVFADGLVLTVPLPQAFDADSVVSRLDTMAYGVRDSVGGASRLVRRTGGGAEQPLIDDVVAFTITADDPDPARIRRIDLQLRVQVPSAELRGPAGYLFAVGGTARNARRWVPDLELRVAVALRNAEATW
jgi:hypothetical protein